MRLYWSWCALTLAGLGWLGCRARPPAAVRGIELEAAHEAARAEQEGAANGPDAAVGAAGTDQPAVSSEDDDSRFVYSREPGAQLARGVPQLPIHINESWWLFRAQQLGITPAQAQKRDAQLSKIRAPGGFWDSQTSLEAVSVWTVLCNECHGGRRSLQDSLQMPAPPPGWGAGEGLFFGKRSTYKQMFNVLENGGPATQGGRAGMPAWRHILSTEMMWALLYFLEHQSGGIESRFPPSLYPRRPSALDKP